MSKIIIHTGTGTYFGLDDGVYVVDTDDFDFDPDSFEENLSDIVEKYGQSLPVPVKKPTMPIRVCDTCGSDKVQFDAYISVNDPDAVVAFDSTICDWCGETYLRYAEEGFRYRDYSDDGDDGDWRYWSAALYGWTPNKDEATIYTMDEYQQGITPVDGGEGWEAV